MATTNTNNTDSENVAKAIQAIAAGDLPGAKQLLVSVIKNVPEKYAYQSATEDGGISMAFWDQQEFIHYVNWAKPTQKLYWFVSAYPRAFFYLGFIAVAERDYQTAIDYLDQGAKLEPTNPKFKFEKAQALMGLKRHSEAFKLLDQISAVGPFVTGEDLARALRGKGAALIEMDHLAEAQDAFKASLELEPGSEAAKNELKYIAQLTGGGVKAPLNSVVTKGKNIGLCVVCGEQFESGSIVNTVGSAGVICDRCKNKSTKKAWQFWK